MKQRALGQTGIKIAPLVLGGNVFGWTADEKRTFELLDAFVDAGLNAIDTADVYSRWAAGNRGGESETLIGKWMASHPGNRDKVVLITKVGSELGPDKKGLSRRWIRKAIEESLGRLQTDYVDVYLSHFPDAQTPYEETLAAYDELLKAGKVRSIGASNLDANQLTESLTVAKNHHLPRYEVLQPEYNLYERSKFEGSLSDLATKEGLGVIVYYSLASGFLSGKYRTKSDDAKSPRGKGIAEKYLNERGLRILAALDRVSEEVNAPCAEVALAWLMVQPGVTAPIASATSMEQMKSLVAATTLSLSREHLLVLDRAGE